MNEENSTGKHLLAVGLVAVIGLAGLVLMFHETSPTGAATELSVQRSFIIGCNVGETKLNARGIAALKQKGREKYGPDFSPYSDANAYYTGVGYCAKASVVKDVLGIG